MITPEVTLVSAAAHLRVSWHTAYRLMLTGALPGQQRKGRWYVVQADVERLAAEQTHEQEGTEP
ncbi:MAG: helix-turn-helix domain-containing protein [Chloroflexi bacterium]|nr:helix-turn-helix domain-containing protein [Chloroflexota bacterium]